MYEVIFNYLYYLIPFSAYKFLYDVTIEYEYLVLGFRLLVVLTGVNLSFKLCKYLCSTSRTLSNSFSIALACLELGAKLSNNLFRNMNLFIFPVN